MGGIKILKLELTADGGIWGVTQRENGGALSWNRKDGGSSLAVQGLRLCLPMQGVRVPSLLGEPRSHIALGPKIPKTKNRSNVVTSSIEKERKGGARREGRREGGRVGATLSREDHTQAPVWV